MLPRARDSIESPKTFSCSLFRVEGLNLRPSRGLAESVDPLDLVLGQSAHARMRATGIGDGSGHLDLIVARVVGDAHLHAVKMASDKGGILVTKRHVESDARTAALLGRGNERCALP